MDYIAFCEFFPLDVLEPFSRWQEPLQKRVHHHVPPFCALYLLTK